MKGYAMARYYFHFTDGKRLCSDANGVDLPDDEAARNEANLVAWDLWNDPVDRRDWGHWTIQVTDGKGRLVVAFLINPRRKMSSFGSGLAPGL
jgi:hypothetical protein